MRDSFRQALDSVLSNRRRALLTVAIIAVGVASLVGIQTAVSVLAAEVAGTFDRTGAAAFTLQPKDDAQPVTLRQARAFLSSVTPGSASPVMPSPGGHLGSAWSLRSTRAQVRSGGAATDPVVRVVACDENYLSCEAVRLSAGRGFTMREVEERQAVAVLGDNVRKKLFGTKSGLGEMVSFGGGRYRVVGVLDRQGALFGGGVDATMLIPVTDSPEGCCVTVRVSDAGLLPTAVAEAGRQMSAVRRLPPGVVPDFEIVHADSALASLESIRKKLSLVALVIGLITMLGASVGLMNSLLVSVKERTREIGVRRALGARARSIERQFLLESVVIGQAGNVAGVLLGLGLGALTALALDGRFTVPWPWLAAATLLSLAVSLASGLLPARRAASLDPIAALRSL